MSGEEKLTNDLLEFLRTRFPELKVYPWQVPMIETLVDCEIMTQVTITVTVDCDTVLEDEACLLDTTLE